MSSIAPTLDRQSQASSSSSSAVGTAPRIWQHLFQDALESIFENLGKIDLTSVHRTCRNWNSALCVSRESIFKNQLLHHLLPGIKEEQLPLNLIKYNPKTKIIAYEETYNAISQVVYGFEFFSSIGVRTLAPAGPIPAYLLEKRYLPSHRVEVPEGSTLGLTPQGKLMSGPQNLRDPANPEHYSLSARLSNLFRARVGGFLEFPNTQSNREFLAANPSLVVGPLHYPMQSPLEQGSPLIAFHRYLEIDVPENSLLRVTPQGVLVEVPGPHNHALNGKRTISFLNTPHNWLTLAAPDRLVPWKNGSPDNPCTAKYLNKNAKAVQISNIDEEVKEVWDIPVSTEWIGPASKLIYSSYTNLQAEEEALALEQYPMTFGQDSIHRILTQIKGNSDLYKQFSGSSTDISTSWGKSGKAQTFAHAALHQWEPALVHLRCCSGPRTLGRRGEPKEVLSFYSFPTT